MTRSMLLNNLFPVPPHTELSVCIIKPIGTVGLALVAFQSDPTRVRVKEVDDNSPFQTTSLQVGQTIAAINTQTVTSCSQAAALIASVPTGSRLTLTLEGAHLSNHPFSHLVFQMNLPVTITTPPVVFGSSRSDAVVRISRVLDSDSNFRIKVGDIVLAVNGMAVTNSSAAYNSMLQSVKSSQQLITIYCVDMLALYREVLKQDQVERYFLPGTFLQPSQPFAVFDSTYKITFVPREQSERIMVLDLSTNLESLHLEDRHSGIHLENDPYNVLFRPFLQAFNKRLELELQHLERTVIQQDWRDKTLPLISVTEQTNRLTVTSTTSEAENVIDHVDA